MKIKSDIEIAQEAKPLHIREIGKKIGLSEDDLEFYGKYKAKVDYNLLKTHKTNKKSKLILTTAINPTPAGEGKTTTTIGLADGLQKIGKNTIVALREPSLRTSIWYKGWSSRWWICSSYTNGRYKLTFYRRFPCYRCCK